MASSDSSSPSPRRRSSLRRLLHLKRSSPPLAVDYNALRSSSPSSPQPTNSAVGKKKAFVSSAFCGLGCAFSDDSSVCSSANSEEKRPKRRRTKKIKKEGRGKPSSSISSVAGDGSVGSQSRDADRTLSERPGRRGGNLGLGYSMEDSFPSFQAVLGTDPIPSLRYHRLRGYYNHRPFDLEEIMNFHHRIRPVRGDTYDRHNDWRLDVDNMTYEDLLELGDKIGYVSTGLREEEIASSIVKVKLSNLDICISIEKERKCSVCLEDYEINDEVGKLGCDHSFHIKCIKKWLLQKNACPVCKSAVSKTLL